MVDGESSKKGAVLEETFGHERFRGETNLEENEDNEHDAADDQHSNHTSIYPIVLRRV